MLKLKRLDKVCLDSKGQRTPSNLTEYLFGNSDEGFYLVRDSNLNWHVKYDTILKVFSKILKPLYKSYEMLRKQYSELCQINDVYNTVKYNKALLEGIPELHLFEIPAGQANLENEFTSDQQCQNLNETREIMKFTSNHCVPTVINKDFESVADIIQTTEAWKSDKDDWESNIIPNEEGKNDSINEDECFDEFTPFERSSVNKNNIRSKMDLGYSTMNYRTSLIPKVKTMKLSSKPTNRPELSEFDKLVMQHVKTSDPFKVTEALLKEISRINAQIVEAKNKLYKLIWLCYDSHVELKKQEYLWDLKTKVEESIFHNKIIADDFVPIETSPTDTLNRVIEHRRIPLYDELAVVINVDEYPSLKSSQSPILFEEKYVLDDTFDTPNEEDTSETSTKAVNKMFATKLHLFVLVHGLGGSQNDMLNLKNHITLVNPHAEFLISNKNSSNNSEKDIEILAQNLVEEVESDVEFYGYTNIYRISFIGFSLGGLIIRAALPNLTKYREKFHSYVSFATPHLGLKLKKRIIAAGLWFMKQFSEKQWLQQLNFEDSNEIEETFMYKLSKSEGLSWFKNVYFWASSQDTYCPFGSARIQVFNDQVLDQNYCPEILQMAENILYQISAKSITRVNANFYISDNYLKSAMGEDFRKNHNP